MKRRSVELLLGTICVLLTFAICVQIKTIQAANKAVPQTENKLRDEVLRWKERHDHAYNRLKEAEGALETERKKASLHDDTSSKAEENLNLVTKLLGLTELTGKGITITLEEKRNISPDTLILDSPLVHDGDIINVINELKNAGAEAISVNGQRVINSTGIVCDGNVIRINGEKIGAPFIIKAIGQPEWLESSLDRYQGYLYWMKSAGIIVKIEKSNNITIPKYEGVYNFEYAKLVK